MKSFGNWWNGLPNFMKVVIIVTSIVLTIVTIKLIRDKAKTITSRRRIADYKSEEEHWEAKGEQPSLQEFNYEQLANKIWTACQGWGTDEQAIFEVFEELENNVDFIKLQEAYGIDEDGLDLSAQLHDELDGSDIKQINDLLTAKGIAYSI